LLVQLCIESPYLWPGKITTFEAFYQTNGPHLCSPHHTSALPSPLPAAAIAGRAALLPLRSSALRSDVELAGLRRSGAEEASRAERRSGAERRRVTGSASELAQAWLQKNGPPSVFWEPG